MNGNSNSKSTNLTWSRQAGKKLWVRKKGARRQRIKRATGQFFSAARMWRDGRSSAATGCAQVKLARNLEAVAGIEEGAGRRNTHTYLMVIWRYDFYVFNSSNNGSRDIIYGSYTCSLHSLDMKAPRTEHCIILMGSILEKVINGYVDVRTCQHCLWCVWLRFIRQPHQLYAHCIRIHMMVISFCFSNATISAILSNSTLVHSSDAFSI